MRLHHCLLFFFLLAAAGAHAQSPPAALLLPESALPGYEADINHAQLIRNSSKGVLHLGKEVYQQVCHNCHGDLRFPGSVPNSLRFAEGEFQHGSDPHTMYQTITRGWRLMVPQVQLTPREKYGVIHYIRDHFLHPHNPSEFFKVTDDYLAGLPKGTSSGPEPVKREPWKEMDYGQFLIGTFEIADEQQRTQPWPKGEKTDFVAPDANIAHKAIAIRLDAGAGGVSQGKQWLAFEHDTMRVAAVWQGEGFIDWQGINLNGRHVARPRTVGKPTLQSANAPAWANPQTGTFEDLRIKGLDGRRYGPLPRDWAHYKGLYRHGGDTVISYSIGQSKILESHGLTPAGHFVRQLNVGKSPHPLSLRIPGKRISVQSSTGKPPGTASLRGGGWILTILAEDTPANFAITFNGSGGIAKDLQPITEGGPAQWPETFQAPILRGTQDGAFQWDSFALPVANPWQSRLRASGVDFTPDGKAAIVCCWDGDVWRIDNIADESANSATWRRIASGLFQPLGVKLIGEDIFVSCRDQIVRLRDLNGDGETDFYESFNSDHQVTEHFHEFAMGLQADDAGNLYYAKSARHARTPLVPHHGTLVKVSADGAKTEILANGFRAANGVCRNPDGSFFVTDQEGHWNPMIGMGPLIAEEAPPHHRTYRSVYGGSADQSASNPGDT
ncbi:MAG: hypothetical protein ACI8W8_003950 [Rhodothermales bacterium]|jgi:hypothetical protein